jgi:hypothetical protein
MKALISTNEPRETGYRVAEVTSQEFEVHSSLFWVDCADNIVSDQFWYDPSDQTIKPVPQPEPEPDENIEQPISEGTQEL